ncbi:MAG: ATP-binding protein [Clostridiales bacterium]|nr:ATP-binding protein [Clostridiales bacterium]
MAVIGRKENIRELERCERSQKSELICVYGRRRVGKTYLVEQTFANFFAFRATGVESGNTRTQLKSFHQRLIEAGDTTKRIPQNWFEAFSRLERVLQSDNIRLSVHGKKIVFFDEFPWFATARSDFLEAFGEFWNRCGTVSGNYMFIICGSATSWIIKNVLEDTGSLYDRVTSQMFLRPFTLKETELFMKDKDFGWSRRQIVEAQMVFGGLPYFFDLLNPDESLTWNINMLILRPHALLRNESKKLLEATLKKSPAYNEIMECLSAHYYGMPKQECFESLSISQGTFSRAVDDLVKCGYVHESADTYSKGHPLRLQLVDPFLLFHYTFLSKGYSDNTKFEDYKNDTGRYMNWRGHAFEVLCMYHIDSIKNALGISGVKTNEYAWVSQNRDAQIDIVIDRDDGIIDICENKYTDTPFTISESYEKSLLKKIEMYRRETAPKKALKLIMICAEGINGVAHTEHISHTLTLDDLFN